MINVVCGIRSTGRICTDLAEEYEKQGHEVRIAYGREQVPEKYQKYAVKIGNSIDVKLHALKARIFDTAGFGSKHATKKFIEWVKVYDPDVIYIHNIHGYYINIEVLFQYLRTSCKKIVWTLHDCWAFTGHCTHFMVSNCNKWRKGCSPLCPEKKQYPKSFFWDNCRKNYVRKKELFTGINNLHLVVPSQWLADMVRESYLREYPIEVKYNNIDKCVFRPIESNFRKKYGLDNKKIVLSVASTWTERKGLNDFIVLASQLNSGYQIVLVGLTQGQIKKLPSSILGLERTNNKQELAEIYAAADFFVNLTYEDNYPTVNLEAEACGLRVLTYNTGGCRETIKCANSKVVETGDIKKIADIIVNSK